MLPSTHSDSEDDSDYVPPPDDHDSDSSDEPDAVETAPEAAPPQTDPTEQKKQRDALWTTFQASVAAPPPATVPPPKQVTIEKTYLFAGKRVTDIVQVPEDSEEASKWPSWAPSTSSIPAPVSDKDTRDPAVAVDGDPSSAPPPTSTPAKRPGPRKPRTALPSIPKASQPKKITTLDKSAMDWRAHVSAQSSDVQDQLNANKRGGGGYLDKVAFLDRVQDRRGDAFEASKANKRRKI